MYRYLTIALALFVMGLLLAAALHYQRSLSQDLPPRVLCLSQAEALRFAEEDRRRTGCLVISVLGTGSMAPYIPAAGPTDIVAYVTTWPDAKMGNVTKGSLVLYRHAASPVGVTMHVAARQSGENWAMAGLANRESDIWMRPQDFVGIVAKTYVWKTP